MPLDDDERTRQVLSKLNSLELDIYELRALLLGDEGERIELDEPSPYDQCG